MTDETRFEIRAIRERWPVPAEVRQKLIAKLSAALDQEDLSVRDLTAITKALASVDRINVADDVASKIPDQSEQAVDERYYRARRALGILDRLTARLAAPGGTVEGAARGALPEPNNRG